MVQRIYSGCWTTICEDRCSSNGFCRRCTQSALVVRKEWLLSLDNLFVFHLIFQLYKTPSQVVHKAGLSLQYVCIFLLFLIPSR